MTIKRNCTGTGTAPAAANALVGGVESTTVGAGTTHADAALLPMVTNHWIKTAANNSGVILPPGNGSGASMAAGDWMRIYNADANTLLLYPPLGGTLNAGTVTTGTVSIATHTNVTATCLNGLDFTVK